MSRARLAAGIALALAATLTSTGPALAAPPGNDTHANSTVVSGLPFTDQVDTSEATSDADDDEIAAQCLGVPAYDASVWYEVTPTTGTGLVADVSGASYSAGLFVATGGPGAWALVGCAASSFGWTAVVGQTYSVIAFDDQTDGTGNGGVLNITIDTIPPPPVIDLTVDPTAWIDDKTRTVTVSGTVICTGESEFAFLEVQLTQTAGRLIIRGFGGTGLACDGATRPWSVMVLGDNGLFAAGKALSLTYAVACGAYDCGVDFEERLLKVRRAPN
jgi:hypothetical protein